MLDFKLEKGVSIYPFAQSVPFPLGCIGQLKIGLKKALGVPYVTSIASAPDYFSLQLQTNNAYLGNFLYTDNLWITLDNENVFGFLQLNTKPEQTFSYTGKWTLQRGCYTFPIELKGSQGNMPLKRVIAADRSISQVPVLNINITGDLSVRTGRNPAIINIGRDSGQHSQYTQQDIVSNTYITSVNGVTAKQLTIQTSDSSIQIQGPQKKSDKVYVIYIGTSQKFPMCPEWMLDSDSTEKLGNENAAGS